MRRLLLRVQEGDSQLVTISMEVQLQLIMTVEITLMLQAKYSSSHIQKHQK